jgi:hypothetical protein
MKTLALLLILGQMATPSSTPSLLKSNGAGAYAPITVQDAIRCLESISLIDAGHGGWLTFKRSNLDSCAWEPATTSIQTSIEPVR